MAFDKNGTVGSAEELDAYGVWVKSEPQDITASLVEAAAFDTGDAIPFENDYEDDFSAGYGDLDNMDLEIPDIDAGNYDGGGFDFGGDAAVAEADRGAEEVSTQLLMKIVGELSMIRSELSTLKKGFAGMRSENGPGLRAESQRTGFFDEEEDEKIALTGDEMENIITSATGFSDGEEGFSFDAGREADEAALKELSEQNELSVGEDPFGAELETGESSEEEKGIDFDNLGIGLDDETEIEEQFPLAEMEPAFDEDFEPISLEQDGLERDGGFAPTEEFVGVDAGESEELREVRFEGANPLTPAPDDSIYLEEDPFVLDRSDFDGALEKTDDIAMDIGLDDSGFDLSIDDFSIDESPAQFETESGDEPENEPIASALSLDEEPAAEDLALDMDDFCTNIELDEKDTGFAQDAVAVNTETEIEAIDDALSTGGELSTDTVTMDDDTLSIDNEVSIEDADLVVDEALSMDDEVSIDADLTMDEALSMDDSLDGELSMDDDFTAGDFETAVDIDEEEGVSAADDSNDGIVLADMGMDDDIDAQVIPEGFEINAKEAEISIDDELEGIAIDDGEETGADAPLAASAGEAAVSPVLRSELKDVLSYMDHLLESLPEDKIEEFAKSEYFDTYKKIFKELGLV